MKAEPSICEARTESTPHGAPRDLRSGTAYPARRVLLTVLGLLAAAGCGGETVGDVVSVDTLPSGVPVVHNDLPADRFGSDAWTLREEFRIGSVTGEAPDVFGDVRGLDVDDAGNIYVLDRMAAEIRVFGPDGEHLRTFGSKGEGPGELMGTHGMTLGPEGHLWVPDHATHRFTVFDTTGEVVDTHRVEFLIYGYLWHGAFGPDDRLVDRGLDYRPEEERRDEILRALDFETGAVDTFPFPEPPEGWEYPSFRFEGDQRGTTMRIPFTRGQLWRLDGRGHVWFGMGEEYRIHKRTLEGDTLRVLTGDLEPVPVTDEERAGAVERVRAFRDRIGGGEADLSRIPDTRAPLQGLSFDDRGRLWVQVASSAGDGSGFDVFDQEGRWVASARTDVPVPAQRSPVIRGDRFHVVVRDSLDVSYVVRGRIER